MSGWKWMAWSPGNRLSEDQRSGVVLPGSFGGGSGWKKLMTENEVTINRCHEGVLYASSSV